MRRSDAPAARDSTERSKPDVANRNRVQWSVDGCELSSPASVSNWVARSADLVDGVHRLRQCNHSSAAHNDFSEADPKRSELVSKLLKSCAPGLATAGQNPVSGGRNPFGPTVGRPRSGEARAGGTPVPLDKARASVLGRRRRWRGNRGRAWREGCKPSMTETTAGRLEKSRKCRALARV